MAAAIHDEGHQIHSAHIATYGERAVDVFYLTRADGKKLERRRIEELRAALLEAAREPPKPKPHRKGPADGEAFRLVAA